MELEDPESGLDEVEPRRLLATIKKHAAPITVLDAMALRLARDAPLTFDTTDTLATQFALSKKAEGDLNRIHTITSSESERMMMWLLEIEKQKDFEDQVVEWRARTTNNDLDNFVAFFSKRDVEVRRLNKMVTGRAAAAGYHSAANIDEIDKRVDDRVQAEMANLAAAVEAAIDAGRYDNGATAAFAYKQETAANVADELTSPSPADTNNAILKELKAISARLEKVEKGGGRRHGGRRHDGTAKDATTKAADDGRKPCVHCGKRHKLPDEKCWALEKNKDDRPNNYVKPPPGFGKGN